MHKLAYTFILILFLFYLSGCTNRLISPDVPQVPSRDAAPLLYAPPLEDKYTIGIGDRLKIASYYDPQLNQDVIVRPDGRISLLLMGEVLVAGMTPLELDSQVTEAYRRVVDSPEITVVVKETAGMSIYLGGEVRNPAIQQLRGPLTVVQAITTAGGFLPSANMQDILILRKQSDGQFVTYKLDAEQVLTSETPDVYLQRSDIVYVPKTAITNVAEFVDQYINSIIPKSVMFSYGYIKNRNSSVLVTP